MHARAQEAEAFIAVLRMRRRFSVYGIWHGACVAVEGVWCSLLAADCKLLSNVLGFKYFI